MVLQLAPNRIASLLTQPGQSGQPAELAQPLQQPAPAPFINGPGGRRMTPEEIERQRESARRQMAAGMDTSPVQHWTQGLARVAQALVGSMQDRDARKAADANTAESDSIARLLANPPAAGSTSGSAHDAILTALTNPYVDDRVRAVAGKMWDQDIEANKPQYFTAGNDRVMYDPRTQQSNVLYQGQSDAEDYAASLGYQPGTPEFNTAMQDFVLRANGPTAYGYDVDLEGVRQDNREGLEGVRQRNRLSLRQTPTFAQTHPRPSSGGGSGGGGSRPLRTTGNVYAPILDKVSRGIPLTPGEQQVLDMRGGRRPSGGGGTPPAPAARTATDPKTGKKVQWNGRAWVPIG